MSYPGLTKCISLAATVLLLPYKCQELNEFYFSSIMAYRFLYQRPVEGAWVCQPTGEEIRNGDQKCNSRLGG